MVRNIVDFNDAINDESALDIRSYAEVIIIMNYRTHSHGSYYLNRILGYGKIARCSAARFKQIALRQTTLARE